MDGREPRRPAFVPRARARVPPSLRAVQRVRAEPHVHFHRPVPHPARSVADRRYGQDGVGSGDVVARSEHGPDHGRLVPRRRLSHVLQRQVAHLACRHRDPGQARLADVEHGRRHTHHQECRSLQSRRSSERLWLQRLDRARAARRIEGQFRLDPRSWLQTSGAVADRRARSGQRRSAGCS